MRVRKFWVYVVVLSFVSSGFAAYAISVCPGLLPGQLFWRYSPVNIKDESAYPDSVFIQAEANWETLGLNIHVCRTFSIPQCIYHDITVSDDSSDPSWLGLTQLQRPPDVCLNKRDNCGVCFDNDAAFDSSWIKLNPTAIENETVNTTNPHVEPVELAGYVLTHELGHALGLDDVNNNPATCADLVSVMDFPAIFRAKCAYTSPQNGCDEMMVGQKYPQVVPAWCGEPVCADMGSCS